MRETCLKVKSVPLIALVMTLAFTFISGHPAYAHDPIFIEEEQIEAELGPYLPDARISFALYGTLLEPETSRGFQFEIPKDETITLSLLIPDLLPEKEIEINSLPWLTLGRPDGSVTELLPEIRIPFAEPFSRTNYIRLLDHSEIGSAGTYQVTIYGATPLRFTVSIGFIEMFGTPVLNVENRNASGALELWYATPPPAVSQIEQAAEAEGFTEEPSTTLHLAQNGAVHEEEPNEVTSPLSFSDKSTDEDFPVLLLLGGLLVAVLLALLPLVKHRRKRKE